MMDFEDSLTDEYVCVDKDDIKQQIKEKGMSGLKSICDKKRNDWKNVPLNVAVTGNSGTGKSSFINAIRGLKAEDDGGAKVDEVEGTVRVRSYPHPFNSNLKFWDLPGVGTPRFPKATYLADVRFESYDFFLILSRDRFTENDTWLATKIRAQKKQFFFVRTKIDNAVNGDKLAHEDTHDEAVLLHRMKQDCKQNLLSAIKFTPDVFLISSYHQNMYDFRDLNDKLITDFPALKREAMVLSLNILTATIIREKAEVLRKRAWVVATLSAIGGAIPVPGVSAVTDTILITEEMVFYRTQFGLDNKSLAVAARNADMTLEDIRKQYSRFFMLVSIENILKNVGVIAISEVAERTASIVLPLIGSLIGAGISFTATVSLLRKKINLLEAGTLEINKFLTGKITASVDD